MARPRKLTSVEICAGGGGQALGLELAGFKHLAVVEIDRNACETLRKNRAFWNVCEMDLHDFEGKPYRGADLLAGGVPCPPFSVAGKQLGHKDERDLFPQALRLVDEIQPKAVLLENVRGLADKRFASYRANIENSLHDMGYRCGWRLLNASDYGVPQLRPRFLLVALKKQYASRFRWPDPVPEPPTVGEVLEDLLAAAGWQGAKAWKSKANQVAPTIVGGSKKHGGGDLGPTRAKRKWLTLGVDGMGIANDPPTAEFDADGVPRLTVQMVARLQGFPDSWEFHGKKTPAYRQVGNAFPPPVAEAIGRCIGAALRSGAKSVPAYAGLEELPLQELARRAES